jgi:hypothetical protein
MFNFSQSSFSASADGASHCAVLLVLDGDTQRVHRLHDFTKAIRLQPGEPTASPAKVNSADQFYLVVESIKADTKHSPCSTNPGRNHSTGG